MTASKVAYNVPWAWDFRGAPSPYRHAATLAVPGIGSWDRWQEAGIKDTRVGPDREVEMVDSQLEEWEMLECADADVSFDLEASPFKDFLTPVNYNETQEEPEITPALSETHPELCVPMGAASAVPYVALTSCVDSDSSDDEVPYPSEQVDDFPLRPESPREEEEEEDSPKVRRKRDILADHTIGKEVNKLLARWNKEVGMGSRRLSRLLSFMRPNETGVLRVLQEASKGALQRLLQLVNLPAVMRSMGEGRSQLYSMLAGYIDARLGDVEFSMQTAYPRLQDLDLTSKFVVLDAFQHVNKKQCPYRSQYIRNVLMTVRGEELDALRAMLDSKGNYRNLHRLVYNDCDDVHVRRRLLDHIFLENPTARAWRVELERQGVAQAEVQSRMREWVSHTKPSGLKIISDIDDTILCSFGPGGIDRRLASGTVYPGILQLYYELDYENNANRIDSPLAMQGNLTFVTARPMLYKGLSMRASHAQFEGMMRSKGLHANPNILAGDVRSSAPSLIGRMDSMAEKKLTNIHEYKTLYPDVGLVFLGDNGQGDEAVAATLAESYPDHLHMAIIHVVGPIDPEKRKAVAQYPVYYCKSYVQAAIHAYAKGLISFDAVYRVGRAACKDFHNIISTADVEDLPRAVQLGPLLEMALVKINRHLGGTGKEKLSVAPSVHLAAAKSSTIRVE